MSDASVPARGRGPRVALTLAAALAAAACGDDGADAPLEVRPDGEAVAAAREATAGLAAAAPFDLAVIDLADAVDAGDGVRAGDAVFTRLGVAGFTPRSGGPCGADAPAACRTLGGVEHVALRGAGEVRFPAPRRVLGFHVSLAGAQIAPLEALEPERGTGIVFLLPSFRLLVTAVDAEGREGDTIRAVVASATYRETVVATDWIWVDTHLLGEVAALRLRVESPIEGLDAVLVDNVAWSDDFADDPDFFTAALIPDTQKYAETPALHALFGAQTAWIAAAREAQHIAFASHLGDIVEHGDDEAEWAVADAAMAALDGVVPYGIVIGNHDFADWSRPELGSPLFLETFPERRFADAAWWGGRSPDGLSSYQRFDTPEGPFLYLHLMVDSPPPTLEWAESVLAANPGLPTAVTTHVYLRENGRVPVPYMAATAPSWPGISADALFDDLVSAHDQIFLVTCGHIAAEHLQVSPNDRGLPVYEMLQDYQNRVDGGEGFLRLLRFYPRRREIRALTYSPPLSTWELDADSHFTIANARVPGW